MRMLQALAARLRGPDWVADRSAVLHSSGSVVNGRVSRHAIQVGAYTHIKGELLTFAHGGSIRMGEYCYLGEHSHVWSALNIEIGNRVLISHNVNIFDNATHPLNPRRRHEQFRQIITSGQPSSIDLDERPVRIEDDVLIGCMSIVLRGVTIGQGAVIGAGSVVTGDVAPYSIVAGNPARLIREIPQDER